MATDSKYLDYDGLKNYHSKLVDNLRDLKFDPQRMFKSVDDLVNKQYWKDRVSGTGYVYGIPRGVMVTVGNELWQLDDPEKFNSRVNSVGDAPTGTPKDFGWVHVSGEENAYTVNSYTDLQSISDAYKGMIVYVNDDNYKGLYLLNGDDSSVITNWVKISTVDFDVTDHTLKLTK